MFQAGHLGVRWAASALVAGLLCASFGPAAADFEAGAEALKRGDYAAAIEEWVPEAEAGNVQAQFLLASLYKQGLGVERDDGEAVRWFRMAAEQGHAKAQFQLGQHLRLGRGVPIDLQEAAVWIGRAAAQNDAAAQTTLGFLYEKGDGVAKSEATALEWFRKGAAQGYAQAQYNVGIMYAKGRGVAADDAEAATWMHKAADQGYYRAQRFLAYVYERGRGVPKDLAAALRWNRKAAASGNSRAVKALARFESKYPEAAQQVRDEDARRRAEARDAEERREKEEADRKARVEEEKRRAEAWAEDEQKKLRPGNAAGGQIARRQEGSRVTAVRGKGAERLDIELPAGWELADVKRLGVAELGVEEDLLKLDHEVRAYVPAEQDLDTWSEAIVVHRFRRTPLIAAHTVATNIVERIAAECAYGRGPQPVGGRQRGKLTVAASYACTEMLSAAVGMFTQLKIVEGDRNYFVLVRHWRGAPFKAGDIPRVAERFGDWRRWFALAAVRSGDGAPKLQKLGLGSGFVVSEDGDVLTNDHVVAACREIRIGDEKVRLRARDQEHDLALLAAGGATRRAAAFRAGDAVPLGESVVAAGYPLPGLLSSDLSVTTGIVSSKAGPKSGKHFLVITAPIQKGNSGGPLLDPSGNVVGVVTAKLDALKVARVTGSVPQNVNFAVRAEIAAGFLDRNGVGYRRRASDRALSVAEIGAQARTYTVQVECWG